MGKITGWGTVDSVDDATQIEQLNCSTNGETEEPAFIKEEADEIVPDSEEIGEPSYSSGLNFGFERGSAFSTSDDLFEQSDEKQCQDLLVKEIDSLSLRFFEDENGETVYDISSFEAEAISLLLRYSKGKEELDLFPIVQSLLYVKRRSLSEDETPEGVNVHNCKSPNFDKLFASVKQALSISE